ncbi:hypothetical protein AURDEDRAFT_165691 [Auricularia subglabra TFB-10046 SS5]|nr:hypothetical protein AURDEDRAFT_165691 [Auricularia subglabra TFB-10046 SS5]
MVSSPLIHLSSASVSLARLGLDIRALLDAPADLGLRVLPMGKRTFDCTAQTPIVRPAELAVRHPGSRPRSSTAMPDVPPQDRRGWQYTDGLPAASRNPLSADHVRPGLATTLVHEC